MINESIDMQESEKSLFQDKMLRKIVTGSTGLGLALMFASLASIQFGNGHGLRFRWHWTILLWMAAAAVWNSRFWKALWQIQETPAPSPRLRKKVTVYSWILLLMGLGAFLYPIRFIAETYRADIGRGLITAALFLGTLVWMVFRFGRAFIQADMAEEKCAEPRA